MTNGKNLIDELEFRELIRGMGDRELSEFTALQTYQACILARDHDRRIKALENRDRKWVGIGSGIGAGISTLGYAILGFFKGN